VNQLISTIPDIRTMLVEDVKAAYNGDPAALSYAEVKLAYPGLVAITSHRIAHELYKLDVPLIPRIMSEYTHSLTGIDIHPGATIGQGFFIDHGTGVVIGETSHIGNNVKIYQGVTLGAKSFPLDEHGRPIKHIQRHPTVEDGVVVYANSTILGGDTVIGKGTVVAGNVFLMQSTPPGSLVTRTDSGVTVKTREAPEGGTGI
jgi:serine O-acetyltransferase